MVRRLSLFSLVFTSLALVIMACQGFGGQTTKPTVIIASPPSGSVYALGEEVVVQSTSTDPAGVTQVALLVDGNPVRQDPSPVTQGQSQFSLIQSWVAETVGQHTLTVRATNSQGATAESGILINVKQQNGTQPTAVVSIATAVPLATLPPATDAPPATTVPSTNVPPVTVLVVTATQPPVPPTDIPTIAPTCVLNSKFIADLTIPDGTVFTPNAVFAKSWRVQNNGSCSWQNFSLVFVSGTQMSAGAVYPVPETPPGATADLTVPMTAPGAFGQYVGSWRIRSAAGQLFGTNLTVVINVPSPATAVPPTAVPPTAVPTVAGCSGQPNDFSFVVSNTPINAGQSVTLSWGSVNNASEVRLNGGEFANEGVAAPGNRVVSPNATTEYKLTAKCNNSGQTREKAVTVTVNAAVGNFAGQWVHNFGTMTLTQNGSQVTGTYQNELEGGNGVLAGIVSGNVLTGTYTKNQTLPIEFTLSADGKRFTGNWNGTNAWCGAKPGQNFPDGCSYQGSWISDFGDGNCPMNLNRKNNAVTGTYCLGTLDGTITYAGGETILTGTYHNIFPSTGPLKFFLGGYTAPRFSGNYNAGSEWCGWRSSSSKPNPCLKN